MFVLSKFQVTKIYIHPFWHIFYTCINLCLAAIIDSIIGETKASPQTTVASFATPIARNRFPGNLLVNCSPMSETPPCKRYFCSKCNQSFSFPGNLSRHRKACEGNFDLKCVYCEKVFYRQDVLKVHMRSKHGVFHI